MKDKNKREVTDFLKKTGIDILGFASVPGTIDTMEIDNIPPRVIVFGYRLSSDVLSTVKDRPSLLYKHHYKTVNWILDQTACRLAAFIQKKGYKALPIPASQTLDWVKQRGHISHKHLGLEAGIGFRGRNGLLVHPSFGSGVRYVSVLTDLELPAGERLSMNCGDCIRCLEACPCKAINKDGLNLSSCIEQLKQFVKIPGVGQYICGVCIKVCNGTGL